MPPTQQEEDQKQKTPSQPIEPPQDKPLPLGSHAAAFLKTVIGAQPKKAAPKNETPDAEEGGPPKAKKRKPVAPPPAQVIDEEKLGASIARGIAEAMPKPPVLPEEKTEDDGLGKSDHKRMVIMERMAQLNPEMESYKGLPERYKANQIKLAKYAAEWKEANPGEEFDDGAAEHEDFINGLEADVEYDDEHFVGAQADLIAEQKIASERSNFDGRIAKVERSERARAESDKIVTAGAAAVNRFWKDLGEEFASVVSTDGKLNIDALRKMAVSDPVKHDIVVAAADGAERAAQALYMLSNDLVEFNLKDPLHAGLSQFAMQQEETMLARPAGDRLDEQGRTFASKAQYARMTGSNREKHWSFSPDDLIYMATRAVVRQAKANLEAEDEKFLRRAKAQGLISNEAKHAPGASDRRTRLHLQGAQEAEADAAFEGRKPISPTISSSPKPSPLKIGAGGSGKNGLERFVGKLLGA